MPSGHYIALLLCCYLHFCAGDKDTPPAPSLSQTSVNGAVTVICKAPKGHGGLLFRLFRVTVLIDSVKYRIPEQEAQFKLKSEDLSGENLYCCQYENHLRRYSVMSPYLKLTPSVTPPLSVFTVTPPPSPRLSVTPSSGQVQKGQTLSFYCSPPSGRQTPQTFLLLRRPRSSQGSLVAPATLVSSSPRASFSVGPVGREAGGTYTCLYQVEFPKKGQVNSSLSEPVHITVTEPLPLPALSVSAEAEKGLECMGSPSYPGAQFSLFRHGAKTPDATLSASKIKHSVHFHLPNQQNPETQYQCQYSLQLGREWVYSELSAPVRISGGTEVPPHTPPSKGKMDLPVILGSFSAGILFVIALGLLGFIIHRKGKAMAKEAEEKRKQREQNLFWAGVHSKDHIVDLTLNRVRIDSEDCESFTNKQEPTVEPIYDIPTSTFNFPPPPESFTMSSPLSQSFDG